MQTIIGTIVYFDDLLAGTFDDFSGVTTSAKCPFLYVNRDEVYMIECADSKIDFKQYDNVKVEVTGMLVGHILQVESIYKVQ